MEEHKNIIQAVAVVDIDPNFTPFLLEQQKWLTSMQLVTEPVRQRQNTKFFTISPGIYLSLSFCQKNKDPIYEIQFNAKPGADWSVVKAAQSSFTSIGTYLCFKTQPNLMSGPICDVQLLSIQRNKNRHGQNKQILNVPHSYKLISHQLPFGYMIYKKVKSKTDQTFKAFLTEKYLSPKASRINLSQLPTFCFPEGIKIVRQIRGFLTFNFVFTLQTAQRIFVTCLVFKQVLDEQKKQKLQIFSNDQLFYERALCLVSNQCYTDQFGECLQHLYRLSMSKSQVPFWKVIQCFCNQLILPLPKQLGICGLTYNYGGIKVDFATNPRYPFISQRALYSIFKFMCIQNIISVFQSLLLQRKVIFVSQSKTILGYANQAFLGLLYPFKWQQVLIPILPLDLKQYLTAPVPLVAGVSPNLVDQSIQTDSVIVYLDKNEILNDEDNPPLPQKLYKQLIKRLQKYEIYDPAQVTQFLQNPQSTYLFKMQEVSDPQFHGHLVRDIFFQFILTFMKNYKKFLCVSKKKKENEDASIMNLEQPALMSHIFKVQDFLSDLGMTKIGSFGYKFTQSSIFTSFIQRKYQKPDDPQTIFFDQCIQRKKSKKQASFIVPVINLEHKKIKNPEQSSEDQGPFFYQKFPSLLKQPLVLKQEIVHLDASDQRQEQNRLIELIQQQFHINKNFFDPSEKEDEVQRKILSLLLNKNKLKYQKQNNQSRPYILGWFLAFYEKQCAQIQSILSDWPAIISENEFIALKKYEYLQAENKYKNNCILGVHEDGDFHILLRGSTKILFVGIGHGASFAHRSSAIVVQILSYRVKLFLNKIIPKQAGLFMDFCEKQAAKDLRASTLKKASQQSWNIQSIIQFKDWLHYQKQFATGATHD